jgi:hypothetical protein
MNYGRVVLGGLVGGVVFSAVSMAVNIAGISARYEFLQRQEVLRVEPRLPFLPVYLFLLFLASIGLVFLYAAARDKLGPGPKSALLVGITVGLIAGLPGNLAQYAWTYVGGYVSMWWTIEMVLGCALATLAGAWIYRE